MYRYMTLIQTRNRFVFKEFRIQMRILFQNTFITHISVRTQFL